MGVGGLISHTADLSLEVTAPSLAGGRRVCTVMGTAGMSWRNHGNGDHINVNTTGTGSPLTGLPWGWGGT